MHPGVSPRHWVTDSGQQRPSTANYRARTGTDAFYPHSNPAQKPGRREGGCPAQGHTAHTAKQGLNAGGSFEAMLLTAAYGAFPGRQGLW